MPHDNSHEAAVREYLAGANRALDRGDAFSASLEMVEALRYSLSIMMSDLGTKSPAYREAWLRLANELAKLPPTLVRHAGRIIDERQP